MLASLGAVVMNGLYIGVDVGTQGAKAVIYDAKTKSVVSRGAYKYDVIKTNVPGRAEQHPSLWIEVNIYWQMQLAFTNRSPWQERCRQCVYKGYVQHRSLLIVQRRAMLYCIPRHASCAGQLCGHRIGAI